MLSNLVVLGLIAVITLYFICKLFGKKYNHPPGPKPWPIIGNIPDPYSMPLIYKVLMEEYRKTYGDIIRFQRLGQNFVFITDYKIGTDLFKNYPEDTSGRPTNGIDRFSVGGHNVFFTRSMDEKYKELRKYIMIYLRKAAEPKQMFTIANDCYERFAYHIMHNLPNSDIDGFYPEPLCYWIGHNILANVFFEEPIDYSEDYQEFRQDIIMIMDSVAELGLYDITPLNWVPLPKKNEILRYSNKVADRIKKEMKLRRDANAYVNDPQFFIDYLMQLQDQQKKNAENYENLPLIDDEYVAFLSLDIYFAGLDAFGIGLCWTVGLLALYPEIQQKLRYEFQEIKARKYPEEFSVSWIDEMPYNNAVVHEVLRWHSLSAFTSYHRMQADVKVQQYDIPKDSIVGLDIYAAHFDERYWDNPHVFNPDRFLSENGTKFQVPKKGFMPFGYGRRICVAERYTVKETHAIFTTRICDDFELIWSKKNKSKLLEEDETNTFFRHTAPFYVEFKVRDKQE